MKKTHAGACIFVILLGIFILYGVVQGFGLDNSGIENVPWLFGAGIGTIFLVGILAIIGEEK
jgi:hypothetical protein